MLDEEAAVLDDEDARARELLGGAVVADAELEPDHARPGGEQVGDVRRHVGDRRNTLTMSIGGGTVESDRCTGRPRMVVTSG